MPVPRTVAPGRTGAVRPPAQRAAGDLGSVTPGTSAPSPAAPDSTARAEPARSRAPESVTRRAVEARKQRTLGRALLITAAATIAPGAGHMMLRRRRSGALILSVYILSLLAVVLIVLMAGRSALLENMLSTRVLVVGALGCLTAGIVWIAVIIRTWILARPSGLDLGRRALGATVVIALCLVVAAPLGFGANLANSQRNLLDTLFRGGGGTSVADAISKPRLNLMLVGSDAGPDRTGARTDTMMVASIDTRTGRTTLFGLPRNISFAQFPPGSPMAAKFPKGFHDSADPSSGNYLLNAVYAWGRDHPGEAPTTPTADPGLNLLHQTVGYMLGLQLDYYVEVNMAGFASIIDALGGLTVDVGPERIPIGGITPSGRTVRPDGYIEPGIQELTGTQALAFARSRTGTTDYARMGRQRCLIRSILEQKSPTDLLANFQSVAAATTNSVSTNIPQQVLPALMSLAGGDGSLALESVSFDPNLPDPDENNGKFNTGQPDFPYMRKVVQDAINRDPSARPPPTTSAAPTTTNRASGSAGRTTAPTPTLTTAAPTSLAATCA